MDGWRRAAVAAMSCACFACGGKLADDALTTDTDAAVDATTDAGLGWAETGPPVTDGGLPPTTGSCGYAAPQVSTDTNGVCSLSQAWTCADGGDLYELQCNCWAQTCECYKNNAKTLAFGFTHCPVCTATADVIAKCPFPH